MNLSKKLPKTNGPPLIAKKETSRSPSFLKKSRKLSYSSPHGELNENDNFSSEGPSKKVAFRRMDNGDQLNDEDEEQDNACPSSNFLSKRGMPSIGVFTVQCARCFKWRIIPTKEKYEAIRECILQKPFTCERTHEWNPDITCEDPEDISQDGTRLWAIDKPNIALPPPGWERLISIRGEGGTKFADVYYSAPNGKKLRSMVEIEKYLAENPEFLREGVNLAQFSFQIPRPLEQSYVKKRALGPSSGNAGDISAESFDPNEPLEVPPISWEAPNSDGDETTHLPSRKGRGNGK